MSVQTPTVKLSIGKVHGSFLYYYEINHFVVLCVFKPGKEKCAVSRAADEIRRNPEF